MRGTAWKWVRGVAGREVRLVEPWTLAQQRVWVELHELLVVLEQGCLRRHQGPAHAQGQWEGHRHGISTGLVGLEDLLTDE